MGAEVGVIAAIAGLALSVGTTAAALAQSGKGPPAVAKPPKPPAPPAIPPPAPVPPPPSETEADEAVAGERKKRAARTGVAQTLLVSPLGGAGSGTSSPTLLGG